MLRAAKTKSPREVGILDMGQRILQPAARTYLHYLSKILKIQDIQRYFKKFPFTSYQINGKPILQSMQ